MFLDCKELIVLYLSGLKTELVTNTLEMLLNCKNLKEISLLNFYTSSVSKMNGMLKNCSSLFSLNMGFWNSKITDKSSIF